jgi:homoserine dehydrogenase
MRIALLGFGHVGRGFLDLLKERQSILRISQSFEPQVTAILTRHGGILNPNGLDLQSDIRLSQTGLRVADVLAAADLIIELTPTDVQTGGAGLEHIRQALKLGKHVVTANKGPLVVAYRELQDLAESRGVQFRFEGTVLGGTPSMVLGLETLLAAGINSVRGIINGTTNYILTQMELGGSYAAALQKAQELGFAEADPTGDLDGWDAAAKAVILANALLNADLRMADVDREGISGITPEMIAEARAGAERWKLIAQVTRMGDRVTASVRPTRLPVSDPLAHVSGAMNALTYSTTAIGDVTLIGAGAGGKATGFAVLSDVLKIHKSLLRC